MKWLKSYLYVFVTAVLFMSGMSFASEKIFYDVEVRSAVLEVGQPLIFDSNNRYNPVEKDEDAHCLDILATLHARETNVKLKQNEADMMNKNFEVREVLL